MEKTDKNFMSIWTHTPSEIFAAANFKPYAIYGSTASDGTSFVPSPICMVASANLAIVAIDKDGNPIKVYANKLYANPDMARKKAEEICAAYEMGMKKESGFQVEKNIKYFRKTA